MISKAGSGILPGCQGKRPLPALDLDPPALPARGTVQFSVLLQEGSGKEEALRALVAEAGPDARVIRVGNPLRAPLTIERILIQTGLVEAGLLTDEEADQAMQQLLRQDDGEQTLLVIEQAETLSQAALQTLTRLALAYRSAGQAALLRIVFVAEPAFAGLVLATPDTELIRDALPESPMAVSLVDIQSVEPDVDERPSATVPPSSPPGMPGVPGKAPAGPASWFQVLSVGTETAPPMEQVPAPFPSPARRRSWPVFWLLLLLFLAGAGLVLAAAVLLHR